MSDESKITSPDTGGSAVPDAAMLHRLMIESVRDYAIFALDPTGRVLTWNPGAERFKGYAAHEIIGRHFSQFYPEEDNRAGKPAHELEVAAATGRFEDEGWRLRKDGSRFWANVIITALRAPGGELVGFGKVTRDLTARKEAEEQARALAAERAAHLAADARRAELEQLTEQLQQQALELELQTEEAQSLAEELESANEELQVVVTRSEEARAEAESMAAFTRGILASIGDPFVVYDHAWRFRYINEAAADVFVRFGIDRVPELGGRTVWEEFPWIEESTLAREMRRAATQRVPASFESFNAEHGTWSQVSCYPLPDGGLATQWRDITARKQTEEAAHYLARVSEALSSSLDPEITLGALARLVVPQLADWCSVQTVGEDGRPRQVAVAHAQPEKIEFAQELQRRYPTDPEATTGVAAVLRSGKPEFIPEIPDAMIAGVARDAEHLRILRELGLRSAMIVPLVARGRTLGALTLISAESRRRYRDADLALAEEIGRRAGLAVDNARLFAEMQRAVDRTARLQAVTAGLARAVTSEQVADTIISEGVAALGAVDGVFCVPTPDGAALEIVHSLGLREETTAEYRRFPISAPLPLSEAVQTGKPIMLGGKSEIVERYPALREQNRRALTEAWMALPLLIGSRALGGLAFGFAEARRFTADDERFAMALAQQAAQALDRADLYAAERAARAEAESANMAKSDFLATMSHELRTPLNAIAGYAELLGMGIHGPLSDAQREAISRIQRSQRHLLALINDILNFARIEAGQLALSVEDVPVRAIVQELEPLVAPQLGAKALTLSIGATDARLTARADADKVRQILLNLVSNAIKFTQGDGRISIDTGARGDRVYVSICDTGSGIPADQLEHIFEPFVQLNRTLASAHEGAGLGLAISRDLARAMGGDVTVESRIGEGSTFTLWLPGSAGGD